MTFVPRQSDYESNPAYRLTDQDRIALNLGYLGMPMREADVRRPIEDVVAKALSEERVALHARLTRAKEWLTDLLEDEANPSKHVTTYYDPHNATRLRGKIEGVNLALSYVEEMLR